MLSGEWLDGMIVDLVLGVAVVGIFVYLMIFRHSVKKALGMRVDWKRRFDRMKETLGL